MKSEHFLFSNRYRNNIGIGDTSSITNGANKNINTPPPSTTTTTTTTTRIGLSLLSGAAVAVEEQSSSSSSSSSSKARMNNNNVSVESVASILVVAGQAGPSNFTFSPDLQSSYLTFLRSSPQQQPQINSATTTTTASKPEPKLYAINLTQFKQQNSQKQPITNPLFVQQQLIFSLIDSTATTGTCHTTTTTNNNNKHHHHHHRYTSTNTNEQDILSIEEKLRRERQRIHYSDTISENGIHTYAWSSYHNNNKSMARILLPLRGNVYVQNIIISSSEQQQQQPLHLVYDKSTLQQQHHNNNNSKTIKVDTSAIDPQISPNGQFCAFVVAGEIYVQAIMNKNQQPPHRFTFGSSFHSIQNGLADFLSQEEMDRYRGFWWTPDSNGIMFVQVNESDIPIYRIMHHHNATTTTTTTTNDTTTPIGVIHSNNNNNKHCQFYMNNNNNNNNNVRTYEDHRYPFAGCANPKIRLGYLRLPMHLLSCKEEDTTATTASKEDDVTQEEEYFYKNISWFEPPKEACEYLTRLYFLPDGSTLAQWQNREQNLVLGIRIILQQQQRQHVLFEDSTKDKPNHQWINLNHLYKPLKRIYYLNNHQDKNNNKDGSFSFLLGSEQSDFLHLYLYTYTPGGKDECSSSTTLNRAQLIRAVTSGRWMVEDIVGVNEEDNVVYVTGTFNSPLERHLYAVPLVWKTNTSAISQISSCMNLVPTCLTSNEKGMHNITMDAHCQYVVDASSDLNQPPSIKVYSVRVPSRWPPSAAGGCTTTTTTTTTATNKDIDFEWLSLLFVLHDASHETIEPSIKNKNNMHALCYFDNNQQQHPRHERFTPPQLISFPASDGTVELHAAVYLPDPSVHGPGPYPLACAVYGGPHVQRVHRSYNSQCLDMRAQRLRGLGFAVVKCDNRGSSRRGVAFENPISRRLGQVEVDDQVTAVRLLVKKGFADPNRVGIYGWSYGGYLAAMCLARAPHVFRVAVAGAPVTSWDGYDTHYTERYMGLPEENREGYKSSALFEYVCQLQLHQKLMIVHGLIDENVHFRHTERLINHLVANGKEYDLLLFPEERHSPRRLRDRVYMEQHISGYFVKHLMNATSSPTSAAATTTTTVANSFDAAALDLTQVAELSDKSNCCSSSENSGETNNYNTSNAKINEHQATTAGSSGSARSSDYLRPIIRGHL